MKTIWDEYSLEEKKLLVSDANKYRILAHMHEMIDSDVSTEDILKELLEVRKSFK